MKCGDPNWHLSSPVTCRNIPVTSQTALQQHPTLQLPLWTYLQATFPVSAMKYDLKIGKKSDFSKELKFWSPIYGLLLMEKDSVSLMILIPLPCLRIIGYRKFCVAGAVLVIARHSIVLWGNKNWLKAEAAGKFRLEVSKSHHQLVKWFLMAFLRLQYLVCGTDTKRDFDSSPRGKGECYSNRLLPLRHHEGIWISRTRANTPSSNSKYLVLKALKSWRVFQRLYIIMSLVRIYHSEY